MKKIPIDNYLNQRSENTKGLSTLREILLSTGLNETFKWNFPVYTLEGKNIVGLGSFKSYYGIWFFQGSYLKDELGVLVNAQEEKTKAMRQWRFKVDEPINIDLVRSYVNEAISNHHKGLELKPRKKPLVIPDELEALFSVDQQLFDAFTKLNLTRKREFSDYILEAKRATTKQTRLEKIRPMILNGKGLNDGYR